MKGEDDEPFLKVLRGVRPSLKPRLVRRGLPLLLAYRERGKKCNYYVSERRLIREVARMLRNGIFTSCLAFFRVS